VPPHDYTPGTPGSTKVDPNNWMLREFRALTVGHRVFIVPDTTKSNPDLTLLQNAKSGTPADPRLAFLINNIKDQATNLLGGGDFKRLADINAINLLLTKIVRMIHACLEDRNTPDLALALLTRRLGNAHDDLVEIARTAL
jgi:hypothetical protein